MTGQPGTHGGRSEAALLWWRELALPPTPTPVLPWTPPSMAEGGSSSPHEWAQRSPGFPR